MNNIGYLTWWTVPDVAAPYTELNKLAALAGFPADCVPTPPDARRIWEKATNVGGARGLKLETPQDLRDGVFLRYGVDPVVRLLTRRVSDKAPTLRRHLPAAADAARGSRLVREAVIPLSPNHPQDGVAAKKQLSLQTVAVLEFNCAAGRANAYQVDDSEGWVDGNITTILNDIQTRQQALRTIADLSCRTRQGGNDVREGIRKLLLNLYRVALRGNGGVYFVPEAAPDAANLMQALRSYINGLTPWKVGQLDPSCSVVTLRGDEATSFDIRQDIIASAVAEFKGKLQGLVDQVQPVLKGSAKGKTAEKVSQSALEGLMEIKAAIAAYQSSLSDDLQALTDIMDMAQTAVLKAAGATE